MPTHSIKQRNVGCLGLCLFNVNLLNSKVCNLKILCLRVQLCSGLEKSPFGAKSDFEIWAFKGFLYLDKKISPKKGLEVSTPKNLKWKKYIRQSKNANGRPLEPLWGSK